MYMVMKLHGLHRAVISGHAMEFGKNGPSTTCMSTGKIVTGSPQAPSLLGLPILVLPPANFVICVWTARLGPYWAGQLGEDSGVRHTLASTLVSRTEKKVPMMGKAGCEPNFHKETCPRCSANER